MRDKKDHATLDLVGFDQPATRDDAAASATPAAPSAARPSAGGSRPQRQQQQQQQQRQQEQLSLLAPTDASGLPPWQRDDGLDLTGLPVWAAA